MLRAPCLNGIANVRIRKRRWWQSVVAKKQVELQGSNSFLSQKWLTKTHRLESYAAVTERAQELLLDRKAGSFHPAL